MLYNDAAREFDTSAAVVPDVETRRGLFGVANRFPPAKHTSTARSGIEPLPEVKF